MNEMPVLALPESSPSFMVIDGQTYFVDKVTLSPLNMLKQVEDFYKDNLEVLKEKVAKHLSDESQKDLDIQVQRIERHLSAGVVALPDDCRTNGTILMLQNNRVYKTRIVLFKPQRISITLQRVADLVRWVNQEISRRDAERFTKFLEWAMPLIQHYRDLNQDMAGVKVDIKVDQDIIVEPMVASLDIVSHQIFVFPDGKHCHVHSGTCNLCTGQASAETFWEDPNFLENFKMVNPHSFANTSTRASQEWRMFLKNQFFVEARIRTEEGSAWRV